MIEMHNWTIIDNQLPVTNSEALESIFTVGNGYLGVRGSYEDETISNTTTNHGVFINGFYETMPISYGEQAYGYPQERQSIISLPDATHIELFLNGLQVNQQNGHLSENIRQLSLKQGIMTHSFIWEENLSKNKIKVTFTRLVSFTRKHILAVHVEVKPLNFKKAILTVKSTLATNDLTINKNSDPRVANVDPAELLKNTEPIKALNPQTMGFIFPTKNSKLTALIAISHSIAGIVDKKTCTFTKELLIDQKPISFDKYACYFDTREDHKKSSLSTVEAELNACRNTGFEVLTHEQQLYLTDYWNKSDLHIANNYNNNLELESRFAMFQLLQSVGKDGNRGIAAKGLSSTGYDGHYFWDTEIYIMPLFTMTQPQIAKKLLINRFHQLSEALQHARQLGYKGALFPWRTINGKESSAYFPASTAAIHINADIMFAIQQYFYFTNDLQFMHQYGLKMLVEASRFYLSYGNWDTNKGFVLNTVTGPDEYTALINNNAYTNLMVKNQLEFLTSSFTFNDVANLGLTAAEWHKFKLAAAKMFITTEGNLIGQDDSFLTKPKIDLTKLKKSQYPLLLHFHPLYLYQHQVIKQADLILAMALMPYRFNLQQLQVNYNYYEPLTTHDSSLSRAAYAIVASQLDDQTAFNQMLQRAFSTDLTDGQHNTNEGLHTASMGGTWLVISLGLAHVRATQNNLLLDPILPPQWEAYVIPITYHGSQLKLSVSKRETNITLIAGKPVPVILNGKKVIF
ncbi:glycoside hydrolase family 65 protein [Paucilactobacillus kaifaensis]|uniref:glycoside hydrolase family 65 protein n=1 Tax=Paucilactobacillus kaifaensis TaxID=2559921 RepID=UPI0010F93AFA|nr:glycosyl hydrolase family 65 protein [Paucilactobacillus kaifaensis]